MKSKFIELTDIIDKMIEVEENEEATQDEIDLVTGKYIRCVQEIQELNE